MDSFETDTEGLSHRVLEKAKAFHVDGHDDTFVLQGTNQKVVFPASTTTDNGTPSQHQFRVPPAYAIPTQSVQLDWLHLILAFLVGGSLMFVFCRPTQPNRDNKQPREKRPTTKEEKEPAKKEVTNNNNTSTPTTTTKIPVGHSSLSVYDKKNHHQTSSSIVGSDTNDNVDTPNLILDDDDHQHQPVVEKQQQQQQQQLVVYPVTSSAADMITSFAANTLVEQSQTTTIEEEEIHQIVHAACLCKQTSREMGLQLDDNTVFKVVSKHFVVKDTANHELRKEARGYLFANDQNARELEAKEKLHQENIAVQREDPDWRKKVNAEKAASYDVLAKSIVQCCFTSLAANVVVPLYQKVTALRAMGYEELFCYGSGTDKDPLEFTPPQAETGDESSYPSTWWGWFDINNAKNLWNNSKVLTWPSAENIAGFAFGDALSCLKVTVIRVVGYGVAIVALALFLWLVPKASFPKMMQLFVQGVILIGWLLFTKLVPEPPFWEISSCAVLLYTVGNAMIQQKFQKAERELKVKGVTPSADKVNELCYGFTETSQIFKIVTGLLGMLLMMYPVFKAENEWI